MKRKRSRRGQRILDVKVKFKPPPKPDYVEKEIADLVVSYFSGQTEWRQLQFMLLGYPHNVRKFEDLDIQRESDHEIDITKLLKNESLKEKIRKREDAKLQKYMDFLDLDRDSVRYDKAQKHLESWHANGANKTDKQFEGYYVKKYIENDRPNRRRKKKRKKKNSKTEIKVLDVGEESAIIKIRTTTPIIKKRKTKPLICFETKKNILAGIDNDFVYSYFGNDIKFIVTQASKHEKDVIEVAKIIDEMLPGFAYENVMRELKYKNLALIAKVKNKVVGGMFFKNHGMFIEIILMAVRSGLQFGGVGSRIIDCLKQIMPRRINVIFVKSDMRCKPFYKKNGFTENVSIHSRFLKGLILKTTKSVSMECYRSEGGFAQYSELKKRRQFLLNVVYAI